MTPAFPRQNQAVVLSSAARALTISPTGLSPSTAGLSRPLRLPWVGPLGSRPSRGGGDPSSPHGYPAGNWFGLPPFRSPLLRGSRLISLPAPTKMFPFGAFPSLTGRTGLFAPCRRSHSGTPGSAAACAYPGSIAACRALPRRPSRAIHRTAWRRKGQGIKQVPLVRPAQIWAQPHGRAALIRALRRPLAPFAHKPQGSWTASAVGARGLSRGSVEPAGGR